MLSLTRCFPRRSCFAILELIIVYCDAVLGGDICSYIPKFRSRAIFDLGRCEWMYEAHLAALADTLRQHKWQTTWDRTKLLTSLAPSSPFNFGSPGAIGQADIVVNDNQVLQQIDGFGGTLSQSYEQFIKRYRILMNTSVA